LKGPKEFLSGYFIRNVFEVNLALAGAS